MSIDKILKSNGLMSLSEYDKLMRNQDFISTGYQEIDEIIGPGKGFPRGGLSEVYGMSRCGKSRFVRDICMRPELNALYIDTENALSHEEYELMRANGVDVVAEQMLENIWDICNKVIEEKEYDIVVVDSIGATDCQPERDDGNTISMSSGLFRAKVMSRWLRGIGSIMLGSKTALVFVNHMKDNVGTVGQNFTKPCGKSIDFHSMVQLRLSGGDSTITKGGTKKDLLVTCTKTRYCIVSQKARVRIELDPFKGR